MISRRRRSLMVLCVMVAVLLPAAVAAQRGGRNMTIERPETPTKFENPQLGLQFEMPPGLQLFTPEQPGRFKKMLESGRFMYVTAQEMRRASVVAKATPGMSPADVKGYMAILETNPPQAKLEGFKKHSVRMVTIGKNHDKEALEFVYDLQEGNMPATIRQVVFVHNGQGFTFTCTSFEAEYGAASKIVFDPLFSQLEFK